MSSQFKYDSIESPSAVRILQLLQGDASDTVQLSLDTVPLDSNPAYEAISYCWGDPKDVCEIKCGEAVMTILVSLLDALKAFRHRDRPRALWADAVCINQADLLEKQFQVLLMPRIYSQAQRVLVWLGADEDGLGTLRQSIQEASAMLPAITLGAEELTRQSQTLIEEASKRRNNRQPNFLDHDWTP